MELNNMKMNGEVPPVERKCKPWRMRTHLERYLIATCVVMFIAFLSMIAVVLYLEHIFKRSKPVCDTAICRRRAGIMMTLMDTDVDPCEDFYNFSCGSYPKVMPAHSRVNRYDFTVAIRERMSRISEELLEAENEDDDPDFVKKARRYYKVCLQSDTETSILIEQILNASGIYRWPILEHDDYEDQLVEKVMALIVVNGGMNALFWMYQLRNYTVPVIYIYDGSVFWKESVLLNDTDESSIRLKEKYRTLLRYSFLKAGMQLKAIESEVDKLIQFETLFANITSNVVPGDTTKTTLKEFSEEFKEVGLMDIVKYIFEYFGHSNDYHDDIPVEHSIKTYFSDLCILLRSTNRRTIYNYLVWRFLAEELLKFDIHFGESYRDIGDDEEPLLHSKARLCLRSLKESHFIHGLNYLVLKHLDPHKSVEEISEFHEQIKEVMDHMFSVESWLDDEGKKLARDRLSNTSAKIGYSKASLDVGLLEEFFSDVNVSETHIENILNEERGKLRQRMFNDTVTVHDEIEITDLLNADAYFTMGYYVLELGIMQPPFYEYGAPKYMNFAFIPILIAHELSHGFDSLDWEHLFSKIHNDSREKWSEEVVEAFKERKKCYVNQYSQYPLDNNGTMVNGSHTIKDNIADNSAVIQAFTAYEKYYLSKSEEPGLPGLDYTNAELFFISFAQSMCETVRDPVKQFKKDEHSPRRYRVIGPLQNFPRFSEIFKCPVGSPMNPKKKCRMWG